MKNRSDAVGSLFLFLLGIGAVLGAIRLKVGSPTEPQPGFFPFLGGLSLIVLSFIIFLRDRWDRVGRKWASEKSGARPVACRVDRARGRFGSCRLCHRHLHCFRTHSAHLECQVLVDTYSHKPLSIHRNLHPLR